MSVGRPLIVGIDRSMYPGDKPPVVSSYEPDELVDQIERLQDDSRRLENLSREGRAWVWRNSGCDYRKLVVTHEGKRINVYAAPPSQGSRAAS